jgi:hypothetical protein
MPSLLRLHATCGVGSQHNSTVMRSKFMLSEIEGVAENEPPSTAVSEDASCEAQVDRTMAMAHLPAAAHVALIGHHTLPLLLALLRHGCGAVRCLRPGAPSPDCEAVDLAWIVNLQGDGELDEALRAARGRIGLTGRVMVEGKGCACQGGMSSICDHALAAGLDVVSFDHRTNRLMLAARRHVAMAA